MSGKRDGRAVGGGSCLTVSKAKAQRVPGIDLH